MNNYLDSLSHDIMNNQDIMDIMFHPSNIKPRKLKKELEIFDYINLKLNDVYVLVRKRICLTSPKKIKIILGSEYTKSTFSYLYREPIDKDVDFSDIKLVCEYVFINNYYSYSTKTSYLHEITHTQLITYKNIEEYYNGEVLPIFMELIHGYYNNTDQLLYRLKFLNIYIDSYMNGDKEEAKEEAMKYIVSTLKAIKLLDLYKNNSNELISDLNKVFSYDITLEQVFNKYQISLDDKPSLDKMLKLRNN